MTVLWTLGSVLILCGLLFAWLALRGRDPRNLVETAGELTRRQHFRNVQLRSRTVKDLTDYTYCYTVGGRTYRLSGTQWTHPGKLFRKTTVVYLKGFPRLAYICEFTGIREGLVGATFIGLGLLCFWIGTQIG